MKMVRFVCVCALMLGIAAGTGFAAPEIVLDGLPVLVSPGVWQYNYIVKNYSSTQHINDLEVDASMQYGWISAGGPSDWLYYRVGPTSRWVTENAPVYMETEKSGFWLQAATPTFYYGGASFTYGSNHQVFATGTMAMPAVPEPGSLVALGLGFCTVVGSIMRKRR